MQPKAQSPISSIDIKLVGSCVFGRNPKISPEQTFNMFISDEWLVQSPGYQRVLVTPGSPSGRDCYSSTRGGFMIMVIANIVYRVSGPPGFLVFQDVFHLNTFSGNVSIDENLAYQIAICDGVDFWIYNWITGMPALVPIVGVDSIDITPGYVTFHDGYFIVPDTKTSFWYLSALNDGLTWNWGAGSTPVAGRISTKPDNALAVLRAPGRGNLIYVFGGNVMELYQNIGAQLFPYVRTSSISIDYGCLSRGTIAAMDNYVAYLGINEKSGPVIMVSDGGNFIELSTDGIDLRLGQLQNPAQSNAFFYKIDGHVFYQITFSDPEDNITLVYDFTTQKFFYYTDEYMNHHIAAAITFFNNTYYFVSLNDASIYELDSKFTTYDYSDPVTGIPNIKTIPRVRICNTARQKDACRFIADNFTFIMDQGNDSTFISNAIGLLATQDGRVLTTQAPVGYVGQYLSLTAYGTGYSHGYVPRVDLSISNDGGYTFGSSQGIELYTQGHRKNRIIFYKLGLSNELVIQLRFWSNSSVTVYNGILQTRGIEGTQ